LKGFSYKIVTVVFLAVLAAMPGAFGMPFEDGTAPAGEPSSEGSADRPDIRDDHESFSFPIESDPEYRVSYEADTVELGFKFSGTSTLYMTQSQKNHTNISVGYAYRDIGTNYKGWYRSLAFQQIFTTDIYGMLPKTSKGIVKVEIALSPLNDSDIGEVGVFRVEDEWSYYRTDTKGWKYPPDMDVDWSRCYDTQTPSKAGEVYRWNITELVDDWNSGVPNHGICLASVDSPDMNDPPPAGSEPWSVSTNLIGGPVDQGGGGQNEGHPPGSIIVTYNVNEAPVATIITIEPANPVPGQTVFLNGTVTDPDDDGIQKCKWWTVDGLLDEGPDADSITAVFSEGAYVIFFSALDDDPVYSSWSDPDKYVLVVETSSTQAPKVNSVECLVNGEPSTIISEDEMAELIIGDILERTGFQGAVSIMGTAIVVNQKPMTDNGDGTYSYFWSTSGMKPGTYAVDFTLSDPISGLVDLDGFIIGPDITLTVQDTTSPYLDSIQVTSGLENGVVQPGELVTIQAIEAFGESGLDAEITIEGPTKTVDDTMADRGFGTYDYHWDTQGFPEGEYDVNIVLEDDFGNRDENGIDDADPDLLITVADTIPPEVMSVLYFTREDEGTILVQVADQEDDLEGMAYVEGPEDLEIELVDEGDGQYTAELDLAGMEPGQYGVEVVIWDHNGNTDQDGLISEPDVEFLLVEPNDPPTIVDRYPNDGAVMEPGTFPVEVTFSEVVTFSDSLEWALRVWNGMGDVIEGKVILTGAGDVIRFSPDVDWTTGQYTVVISDRLVDSGGLGAGGYNVWTFNVQGTGAPVTVEGFEPQVDPTTEAGTSLVLNVSISNAERIEWWVNGKLEGEGSNFTLETPQSGTYAVAAVGMSDGQIASREWRVTVSPAQDTSDGDDNEVTEVEDDSGNNTLAGGVLGAMGAVLIVIALLLFLRPGKGGKPQQGKQAAVGRDAAKVTTPQAAVGRDAAKVTTPQAAVGRGAAKVTTPQAAVGRGAAKVTTPQGAVGRGAAKVTTPQGAVKGPAPAVRKDAPRDGRSPPPGNSAAGRPGQAIGTTVVKKVQ